MATKLRPNSIDDIIGNDKLKYRLKISLAAAKKENRAFPHVIFQGDSGCGKTTFARALANAQGGNFYELNAAAITNFVDLLNYFTRIKEFDVLFIDEIHALHKAEEEFCYPVMEDFEYSVNLDDTSKLNKLNMTELESLTVSKFLHVKIPQFTLVGATTDVGSISGPMMQRFKMDCQLTSYEQKDIELILRRSSKILGISLTDEAYVNMSKRCKEIPRIANAYIESLRDFAIYKDKTTLDENDINEAMDIADIDIEGWNAQDRSYIAAVEENQPVGIQSIAAATGFTQETIRKVIEPPMLRKNKIKVTPGGRVMNNFKTAWANTVAGVNDMFEL